MATEPDTPETRAAIEVIYEAWYPEQYWAEIGGDPYEIGRSAFMKGYETGRESKASPVAAPFPLQRQLDIYEHLKPRLLLHHAGKWVLVQCNDAETWLEVSAFDTQSLAIEQGYNRYGNVPFLTKLVTEKDEVITMPWGPPESLAGLVRDTAAEHGEPAAEDHAWADRVLGHRPPEPDADEAADYAQLAEEASYQAEAAGRRESRRVPGWRMMAAKAFFELESADSLEVSAVLTLASALRSGLTPEQQRTVAMDLLGEPHVSMHAYSDIARPSPSTILVTARAARGMAGRSITVLADTTDPWWQENP